MREPGRRNAKIATAAAGLAVLAGTALLSAQAGRPVRTFPQFVGTWVLDEAASTGRLEIAPRIARSLTIATTPETITVAKRLRLHPLDRVTDSPPPEVYRLDGTETSARDERTGVALERRYRFTLVADMLALTIKETRGGAFTLVTDAYSVEGDVLTLHRQLSSVTAEGRILVMQEPANNFRHTFVYRRVRNTPAP